MPASRLLLACLVAVIALIARPASAHPAPFSYLDVELHEQHIEGTLTVHTIDVAHELGFEEPSTLLDERVLDRQDTRIKALLRDRFAFSDGSGAVLSPVFGTPVPSVEQDALRLPYRIEGTPPAALQVDARMFPYDPAHQTFVNIYEDGELVQQFLFGEDSAPQTHYAGTAAGVAAVFATFLPSGAHHVLIGPDHVLFLIGLILLGGSLRRLAIIVTAFTLGHSVTLALAATGTFAPPAWLIEPLIALSIVIVGVDNLLRREGQRDLRPLFALVFGLVHGFGFAFVLREFGLPPGNLAWSLLAFNIGVEIGQLAIVVPFALALAWIRARWPIVAKRIVIGGSLAVILAGAYWFVDRVLNLGSG
ncbi:HupE/UreJ family protein [Aurantiacibacter poecillastricola]|uniref:HupE/UreJ family protein n=1 Tax=Aurantiacibacter poecillastricola TaxID=3064385 RepID=UPI0027401B15|nr:HupE/UreJ family protein [Aurantiacibacter sp. 219JJ12-13]MDP5261397.1 HupE/UreJ family protein [Aurantiacibacter sp. 219JJ12-13]